MGKKALIRLLDFEGANLSYFNKDDDANKKEVTTFARQGLGLENVEETALSVNRKLETLASHYEQRIKSIAQGFELLIQSSTLDKDLKERLSQYAQKSSQLYVKDAKNSGNNIIQQQKNLKAFTNECITLLQKNAKYTRKQAIRDLGKAECYAAMKTPRPTLVTISKLSFGEQYPNILVQQETPLPALSDDLKKDYLKILTGIDKPPDWFRALSRKEQAMLRYVLEIAIPEAKEAQRAVTPEIVKAYQKALKEYQRAEEGESRAQIAYGKVEGRIKDKNKGMAQEVIDSLMGNEPVTRRRNKAKIRLQKATSALNEILDRKEQKDLREAFARKIDSTISTIPSALRTLPGVANFSEHRFRMYSPHHVEDIIRSESHSGIDKPLIDSARLRSSMIGARDVSQKSQSIRDYHAGHNAKHIVGSVKPDNKQDSKIPVLFQTLVTPLRYPDSSTYKDKERATEDFAKDKKHEVFSTNHPLNIGRFISPTDYKGKNGKVGQRLIKFAREQLKGFSDQEGKELAKIIDAYEKLLKIPVTWKESIFGLWNLIKGEPAEDRNRELFLASYERMMIEKMNGVSHGACISGRDREGIEILHTDAMLIYLKKFEKIPRYDDEKTDRDNFVKIFAALYVTRHQSMYAGMNALGSNGIKTPKLYLPADICQEIAKNQYDLDEDSKLSSNNKLGKIVKDKPSGKEVKDIQADFLKFEIPVEKQSSSSVRGTSTAGIQEGLPPTKNAKKALDSVTSSVAVNEQAGPKVVESPAEMLNDEASHTPDPH